MAERNESKKNSTRLQKLFDVLQKMEQSELEFTLRDLSEANGTDLTSAIRA